MGEDFKINVFFNQEGEELESVLSRFLISMLNKEVNNS